MGLLGVAGLAGLDRSYLSIRKDKTA
jgi:hypothetical protein